jgi:stearoyl-CoA desaturase (delta-9 desaturase)
VNVLSSPRTTEQHNDELELKKPLIEHFAMAFGILVPLTGVIAAMILLWGRGISMLDLILLVSFYTFTTLGITVGFHRMFTHRALQGGGVVRFILAVGGSMSGQGPLLEWCAVHRQHHKHSDRDGDPHSPHLHGGGFLGMFKGMIHSHVGWLFIDEPKGVATAVPDLVKDPILSFVDRWFWLLMPLGWIIPGAIAGLITKSWMGAFSGFIWGGLVRTFLLHHATWSINSVCHVWGTRPFRSPDHSRNNVICGLLAFGEGWHNNHHAFPTSARHGLRWWQFDLSWVTIWILQKLGLVWNVRLVPENVLKMRLESDAKAPPRESETREAETVGSR